MANAPDYAKMLQDAAAAFKVDPGKMKDAFQSSAGYGEKFSKAALTAAEESTELSAKWTREMLEKLGELSKAKEAPADYGKAMADFAQAQAGMMSAHMSAFAEIAKKLQSETVELVMKAAQEGSVEAQEAVKSATAQMGAAAKKATK